MNYTKYHTNLNSYNDINNQVVLLIIMSQALTK